MRANSNRIWERNVRRLEGSGERREKSFCLVVVELELILSHPWSNVICVCFEFLGKTVHFSLRGADFWSCVSSEGKQACDFRSDWQ